MKPVRKEGLNLRLGKKDWDGKKMGGYAHGKAFWQQTKDLLLKVEVIKKNSRISQSQKILKAIPNQHYVLQINKWSLERVYGLQKVIQPIW